MQAVLHVSLQLLQPPGVLLACGQQEELLRNSLQQVTFKTLAGSLIQATFTLPGLLDIGQCKHMYVRALTGRTVLPV